VNMHLITQTIAIIAQDANEKAECTTNLMHHNRILRTRYIKSSKTLHFDDFYEKCDISIPKSLYVILCAILPRGQ
jgi:hypothetical protein